MSEEEAINVLDMYMSIYIGGTLHSDLSTVTPQLAQKLHSNIERKSMDVEYLHGKIEQLMDYYSRQMLQERIEKKAVSSAFFMQHFRGGHP